MGMSGRHWQKDDPSISMSSYLEKRYGHDSDTATS